MVFEGGGGLFFCEYAVCVRCRVEGLLAEFDVCAICVLALGPGVRNVVDDLVCVRV